MDDINTDAAVETAVEAIATSLTLNKTVIIAGVATLVGVAGTIIGLKLKDKLVARYNAAKAVESENLQTS
jgi:hypothetical protein